ncbi:DUF262 domain-containing protein [Arthrospira platensis]|uniref:GmrSD restriction endonucleases N-terminal domain-containing protein n=2 Tax=Limnospira platensis TaxID=118562 RepID=A0A5M3TAU1_LIMPL|nr:DUF262 domain-containing protein [Arthrospira platensis]AMW28361.1 hypothetical protein AP285_10620 [Arthrospira platensis YZ]MBD2671149.1 DUF262 domain-containing protein [Arthrospira platensis FACHB-439]MBD2712342.1 DUF262 domain-containing protein [Arthrospira platensis FACHB-835]MDT9185058.1 DUF262 domain-containing protein [Limnospira sp. PMC 289.06]MDT9297240.1 DUF262 domain-containing protein [Arthrospira platensis PCC 7345]MDT9312755.1 DUF262 domain-containing protein [Limnospira s
MALVAQLLIIDYLYDHDNYTPILVVNMSNPKVITTAKVESVENQIRENQKRIDYNTLEYPIEVLVDKYLTGIDENTNEIFIPDYQREMAWDEAHQSKFIESVFLGLPIPYIFIADVSQEEDDQNDSRLEIIDGTQRIRTLARFINNQLQLCELKKLTELNGFHFQDLSKSRQRRFLRNTIRLIKLTEDADEEVRRDLFERINSGSIELNQMEKRRGSQPGLFLDLIEQLSKEPKFISLCAFSETAIKQRDPQEYVLRFFAFLEKYQSFSGNIHDFLDNYLKDKNEQLKKHNNPQSELEHLRHEFMSMLSVIETYFPDGLRTGKHKIRPITRIKFESICVGVALALREQKDLVPRSTDFLESPDFKKLTSSDASSSGNKVIGRIDYVRNQVLG